MNIISKDIITSVEKSYSTYTGTPVTQGTVLSADRLISPVAFSYLHPSLPLKPAPISYLPVFCQHLARGFQIIGTNRYTSLLPNWRHSHATLWFFHKKKNPSTPGFFHGDTWLSGLPIRSH